MKTKSSNDAQETNNKCNVREQAQRPNATSPRDMEQTEVRQREREKKSGEQL